MASEHMSHRGNGGHLSEELVDQVASGRSSSPEADLHLQGCAACRMEVERTRRVIAALTDPVELLDPPPQLWSRIQAELKAEATGEPVAQRPESSEGTREVPPRGLGGDRTGEHRHSRSGARPAGRRRRVNRTSLIAAAAVGMIVGGGAVAAGFGLFGGDDPAVVEVGAVELAPVSDDPAAGAMNGQAQMDEDHDGRLQLSVEVSELPQDGYLEVWLRDPGATRLVSLGVLDTTTGTMQVPQGIDLTEYPVVDVSLEQLDGDPAHSGETLMAGDMTEP